MSGEDRPNAKDSRVTNHELHAFRFIIWVGALTRYLLYLGAKPFKQFYKPSSDKHNFPIGFASQLIIVCAVIVYLFYYSSK